MSCLINKFLKVILMVILCGFSFVAFATSQSSSASKNSTPKNPISYTPGGGIQFKSQDGQFTLKGGAFAQFDGAKFRNSRSNTGLSSGTAFQRVRANVSGNLFKDFGYRAVYDFVPNRFTNLYVSYNGFKRTTIRMGQFAPVFTLENYSTTPEVVFMGYSLPVNVFAPNFSMGALYRTYYNDFTFGGDIFTPRAGNTVTGNDPLGMSARVTYSPVHTKTDVWHFGLGVLHQDIDSSKNVTFSTTPEMSVRNTTAMVNTGAIANSKYYDSAGAEVARVWNPWYVQAELIGTKLHRIAGNSTMNFYGDYIAGGYFFTGESRLYDFPSASFDGITKINNPKLGAWQIAARLSQLNLSNDNVRGGKELDTTLGLNWYLNQHLRFIVNYIYADFTPATSRRNSHSNIIGLRMQARV